MDILIAEEKLPARRVNALALDLVGMLRLRFPMAFQPVYDEDKGYYIAPPLKVGIHEDLRDALPEIHHQIISRALILHTSSRPYLRACCTLGAPRVGLLGKTEGYVDQKAVEMATRRLQGK